MNVTVFGATGRTGGHVVAEALRRRHRVTAFTRQQADIADVARVVRGDGRDPEAVTTAVDGADGVIAVVAARSRKGPHHTAAVARVIVDAMARTGASRLITSSAYPIVADRPRIPVALLRWLLADAYADTAEMERLVSASGLDWTVVRLNRLLDGPARGDARLSTGLLDRAGPITRADVAATLLDLAETGEHSRTAVNLCGG